MSDIDLIAYIDPELKGSLILRRYLDLPKFVDFLRTGELFLGQASCFDDPLEGTLPESFRRHLRKLPDFIGRHGDPTKRESSNKERTYLSCWTHGAKDNMALWKLYGRSNESVAITTTIECLTFVAPSWGKFGRVDIKKVRYINHAGKLPNGVYTLDDSLFGLKHQAYAFEKEIRIVVTRAVDNSLEGQPKAIRIPVNMNDFLRSIVVAPESGDWFFDLVVDLASKYNVIAPIRRSSLTQLIKKANNA